MPRFSANLGYLWTDLPLTDAIRAAARAGFDAVECHWPYDVAPEAVAEALNETGLPMLGLNTRRGDRDAGEMGLAALPGREADAERMFQEALSYAVAIGAGNIHVMAGNADGRQAFETFVRHLRESAEAAAAHGVSVLIEPLNAHDAPGYFLNTTDQARAIIEAVNAPNLKLMFDCYHVGQTEGNVLERLRNLLPLIGHIQFAGVPDRGPPDRGTLDYREVFGGIDATGWTGPLGAEYRPDGPTDASLDWMAWDHS